MLARAAHRVMTMAAHYGRLANATLPAWGNTPKCPRSVDPHRATRIGEAASPGPAPGPVRLPATTSAPLPVLGATPLPTPNPLAAAPIHPTTLRCAHDLTRLT